MIEERESCEALIGEKLQGRQEDFQWYQENPELSGEPFAHIDHVRLTRVILSGGGPSDRIEITHSFGEVDAVAYVYQDWYDGARREVYRDTAIWAFAESLIEGIGYDGK